MSICTSVTLWSSALEQDTENVETVLEPWQVEDEDLLLKIDLCACKHAQKPKPNVHIH